MLLQLLLLHGQYYYYYIFKVLLTQGRNIPSLLLLPQPLMLLAGQTYDEANVPEMAQKPIQKQDLKALEPEK